MGQGAWKDGEVVQGALKLCPTSFQGLPTNGWSSPTSRRSLHHSMGCWTAPLSMPEGRSLIWTLSSDGNRLQTPLRAEINRAWGVPPSRWSLVELGGASKGSGVPWPPGWMCWHPSPASLRILLHRRQLPAHSQLFLSSSVLTNSRCLIRQEAERGGKGENKGDGSPLPPVLASCC